VGTSASAEGQRKVQAISAVRRPCGVILTVTGAELGKKNGTRLPLLGAFVWVKGRAQTGHNEAKE
jgi:hypothetical protein